MYNRNEIKKYNDLTYKKGCYDNFAYLTSNFDNDLIKFDEFLENYMTEVNYENDFFCIVDVYRFNHKLLLEFIKLGDEDGYYKEWSWKKFMVELKAVCDSIDYVYVSNYDLSDDDPINRAFFLSMLLDISEYKNFNEAYFECGNLCRNLINITEQRLQGIWWNSEFEKDEMLFCSGFLTPYFNKISFEKVIFNHGNREFGKDYVLVTTNMFGGKEYYGVQVKAGKISGSVNSDIQELINQINMAFTVPYKLIDGTNVYMAKVIIAISGNYSENAQEIILNQMDRYKLSNIIFLGKKELSSICLE